MTEIEVLKQRISELENALAPFAEIFGKWTRLDSPSLFSLIHNYNRDNYIEIFRKAAEVFLKEGIKRGNDYV